MIRPSTSCTPFWFGTAEMKLMNGQGVSASLAISTICSTGSNVPSSARSLPRVLMMSVI